MFELFNATLLYNLTYGANAQPGLLAAVRRILEQIERVSTLAVCAVVVAAVVVHNLLARREPARGQQVAPPWSMLAVLWVVFDLAGASAGGNYFPHYFLPLTLSLSLTAGFAYWTAAGRLDAVPGTSTTRAVVAAVILGPLLFLQVDDAHKLREAIVGPRAQGPMDRAIAFVLNTRKPGDTLFTWDFMPVFYAGSKMRSPSLYLSAFYVLDSPRTAKGVRDRIVSDLERTPPTFLAEMTPTYLTSDPASSRWLRCFVDQNYRLGFSEAHMRVYVLTAGPGFVNPVGLLTPADAGTTPRRSRCRSSATIRGRQASSRPRD